jgi:transcriptional regulator with XRE-family HTH domain
LERGSLNPTIMTFITLCAALDVEPSKLLSDVDRSLKELIE